MKITAIELIEYQRGLTVHAGAIDWLWVRLQTDEGLTGLGETYPLAPAEKAVIRRALAPLLLGKDPLQIALRWAEMFRAVSYSGWAGAEIRAISAVDTALWDLAGKAVGVPVYQLLGGASRESIPIYNTCYDRIDFLAEPERLAAELLESGIAAMKIWPFDAVAAESGGQFLTADQMRRGLEPLARIRRAFGDRMDVAMEFHGYWNLPCAIRIAQALEEFQPLWLEEMMPQDNLAAYRELASATSLPLCLSERLMTRWGFRELLDLGAARIIMLDIAWCGGISEARKIAATAETWYLPVAPHNCGGPVLHFASAHLAANLPNLYLLETVRRHYLEEHEGLLSASLAPVEGRLPLPPGPGLGVELDPGVLGRPGVSLERIA
jgi:L-alanine-DL-glutamate epimerase-like enolase superfamily enzyme